jgi:hypothetical protein
VVDVVSTYRDLSSDDPLRVFRRKAPEPALWRRLASRLGFGGKIAKRGPLPSYVFSYAPEIKRPEWDYVQLMEVATTSWVMRQVIRAITQEVLGHGWEIMPRFKQKCNACGKEFQAKVDECSSCHSRELREPSQAEWAHLDELLREPNPDYNLDNLFRSLLFYFLTVEDCYVSIAYKRELHEGLAVRRAQEIYIEDSRFIFPVADAAGHLGNDQFFCPDCYGIARDEYVSVDEKTDVGTVKCKLCGAPLVRTAYVMEFNGAIRARFGEDEIIHLSPSRLLPNLFGNPKMISVIKLLQTLYSMDDYNFEVYSGGSLGGFISFPGMDQSQVTEMKRQVQEELKKKDRAELVTGKGVTTKKVRNLWLGVQETPAFLRTIEDPRTMQSLDFWKSYREVVCAVYGVTPVFVSILESGKAGTAPRMQIDVQNRVTLEIQKFIEDAINDKLLKVFEIYDWQFFFAPIELKDTLRETQIQLTKANTARMWLAAGFDVELDENGEIVVSGVGSLKGPAPELGAQEIELPKITETEGIAGDLKVAKALADTLPRARLVGILADKFEVDLKKVLSWARDHKDNKTVKQVAFAKGKVIINEHFENMKVVAKKEIERKIGPISSLSQEQITGLEALRAQALLDFKKILFDELKR